MCVFMYLLHIEWQSINSPSKLRTFLLVLTTLNICLWVDFWWRAGGCIMFTKVLPTIKVCMHTCACVCLVSGNTSKPTHIKVVWSDLILQAAHGRHHFYTSGPISPSLTLLYLCFNLSCWKMPVKAFFLDKRKSMWLVSINCEVLPINTGPNGLSAVA